MVKSTFGPMEALISAMTLLAVWSCVVANYLNLLLLQVLTSEVGIIVIKPISEDYKE